MRTKQFFYVCVGVLMLAIAYSINVSKVHGQTGTAIVGFTAIGQSPESGLWVILQNGDVLLSSNGSSWSLRGNIYGPVQVEGTSITDVKEKFRGGVR